MTVLGLVVCVIAIAVVENEQYKDLRDRNKRQGLAYGLSLFFLPGYTRDKNIEYYETNNNKHKFKGDKNYEENDQKFTNLRINYVDRYRWLLVCEQFSL